MQTRKYFYFCIIDIPVEIIKWSIKSNHVHWTNSKKITYSKKNNIQHEMDDSWNKYICNIKF